MPAFPDARFFMFWEATLRHAVEGKFRLHGECDCCGHAAPLDAEALARRFPVNWRLKDLERRLVCMKCFDAGRPFRRVSIERTNLDGTTYSLEAASSRQRTVLVEGPLGVTED
jgi:hypothetical protein